MKTPSNTDHKHRSAVLAVVLVSYLMIVLDISIVITALPKIEAGLGFSHTSLSWVSNAYTLVFGGVLLLGARAGDLFGRRRMMLIGLAIFSLASLAIGLAQSPAAMIISRAIQGLGAAVLAPSTLTMLSITFEEGPDRTKALSYYGATAGIGSTIGLVLGGIFADWLSWRVGFFINLPIGLALILCGMRYLPETERHQGELDGLGALTSTIGMSALVFGIVRSAESGWTEGITLTTLIAAVVLLIFFILHERKVEHPILPLRLFASMERSIAYATRALFLGAAVGFYFFATQYLQGVLGYTPFQAGVAFLPTTIANFVAAMLTPRLVHRYGRGAVLAVALLVSVIGTFLLSQVSLETTYLSGVALPLALIGLGQGGALSPLTASGVAGVAVKDTGAASGLVNVAHQVGGSLGLAILIVIFDAAGGVGGNAKSTLLNRISASFMGGTVMLLFALALVGILVHQFYKKKEGAKAHAGG